MTREQFGALISEITSTIEGRALDGDLQSFLDHRYGAKSPAFEAIRQACHAAIADGWMCEREAGGIAFGRVVKPGPATNGFSVDVVRMKDIKGPHHRHPSGEIDMIMPITEGARFDGYGAGWCVYGPDSAHSPTVTDGEALVLYLLPNGEIEFTR